MNMTHVNEILHESEYRWDDDFSLALPLAVGSAFIDPQLIGPRDAQEQQDVEELIAFRTSCI